MTVYLVGAGPGDPRLLTLAGFEVLQRADVVVHDRLVDEATLALARPGAELIDVGKAPFGPGTSQKAINELLVGRGRDGVVVRLKGGDPYVFGRGGEEAEALAAAGITYEVVPGVSSLAAVPGAAGVPLTMRGVTSTVVCVTGHDPSGTESAPIDWAALAAFDATLVIVMGAARHGTLAEALIAGGRSPETPVVVVERGTTPEQASWRTTLAGLGACAVAPPATIVVGEVARARLASIEDRVLHGKRVLVTRPRTRSGALVEMLEHGGARAVFLPTIAIGPPPDGGEALRAALRGEAPAWIVCTSVNAVDALFAEVRDARAFGGVRVAAVGSASAARLAERGVRADLVPEIATSAGLIAELPPPSGPGELVVYPRPLGAGETFVAGARALGYRVVAPVAYASVRRAPSEAEIGAARRCDAAVLSSPSSVAGLIEALGVDALPPVLVAIGPTTATAIREAGLSVAAEALRPEPRAVLDALASSLGRPPDGADRHR